MKQIKKIFFILVFIILAGAQSLMAGISFDTTAFYKPMSVIHVIVLLTAVICLVWALKILSLVKGGLMSKSWQMFGLGFGFLIIAQILSLGDSARLLIIPEYVTPALYLVMAITWLYGLYQTRKVLG